MMEERKFFQWHVLVSLSSDVVCLCRLIFGQSGISCHLWKKVIGWSNKNAADFKKATLRSSLLQIVMTEKT